MLTRVLEPEVMDSAADARDYDAMDHAEVNRRFVADFLAQQRPPGEILDLGTGTAQIPIELAQQDPNARIVAADLAESMLALAEQNIAAAGLADRIRLVRWDAKALACPAGLYAAVVSNSIVHHIAEPRAVLAEAVRVAAPGGVLLVRDLLRPADQATLDRLVATYALKPIPTSGSCLPTRSGPPCRWTRFAACVASLGFAPAAVAPTSDRHWTWTDRRPAIGR